MYAGVIQGTVVYAGIHKGPFVTNNPMEMSGRFILESGLRICVPFTANGSVGGKTTRKSAFKVVGKILLISIPICLIAPIILVQININLGQFLDQITGIWLFICLPILILLALVTPGLFPYSAPTIICNSCDYVQPLEEFLNLMEKKLVGTTETTKTISSARPAVGATIGRGGPGLALGGYKSTSTVPIRLGRFRAMGICPECENKGKCTFETEVQVWVDSEGNETTEIVGEILVPKFGIQ